MDPRYVAASKLLIDHRWQDGDAETREYSTAELDAIANFSWPWEGMLRAAVARLQSIQAHCGHLAVPQTRRLLRVRFHPR